MTIVHARVRDGRLVVDEPTDLPEGASVELLVLEGADDVPESERAALDASIDRGLAEAARGETVTADQVIARLRAV